MIKKRSPGGAWAAQSVNHPTLGFRSGHGLAAGEFEPRTRLWVDGVETAWRSLPVCFSLSLFLTQINK